MQLLSKLQLDICPNADKSSPQPAIIIFWGKSFSFSARSVVVGIFGVCAAMLLTLNVECGCWSSRAVQQSMHITVFPFALPAIFILSRKKLCLFLHLDILSYHKV